MKYLLDTCVVSDFIKGDFHTLRHLHKTSPGQIAISTITSMEVAYSFALNPERAKKIRSVYRDFLKVIHVLSFEEQDAICCGDIRSTLKQQGLPIGSYDLLLAGTALNRDMILVSSNVREFSRIQGLQIENWRHAT